MEGRDVHHGVPLFLTVKLTSPIIKFNQFDVKTILPTLCKCLWGFVASVVVIWVILQIDTETHRAQGLPSRKACNDKQQVGRKKL